MHLDSLSQQQGTLMVNECRCFSQQHQVTASYNNQKQRDHKHVLAPKLPFYTCYCWTRTSMLLLGIDQKEKSKSGLK